MIDRSKAFGLLMGVAAALVGGGWQVATRAATTAGEAARIAPQDLVVLRYVIPALVLAPVWWRFGLFAPRSGRGAAHVPVPRARFVRLVLLWIGAGLPFGLVAMAGSRHAPAAHMGVLMAGATPLFATLLAFVAWRERPRRSRLVGLALMTLAVGLLGGTSLAGAFGGTATAADAWRGDLLFLAAAWLWAVYTLAFRGCGLTPWQAAAVVNAWSALVVLAWVLARGGTGLAQVPLPALAWQVLWQGLLGGVLGLWTFSVAIERLGAAQAAAFGALAPVVSALGGWWCLDDALTWLDGLAVAAAVAGVVLASEAMSAVGARRRRAPEVPEG
ncbi:MAG: DMT family transporter [Rubrivivax sp.]|nr:DMT family transporter [Rubrivivax sp.]